MQELYGEAGLALGEIEEIPHQSVSRKPEMSWVFSVSTPSGIEADITRRVQGGPVSQNITEVIGDRNPENTSRLQGAYDVIKHVGKQCKVKVLKNIFGLKKIDATVWERKMLRDVASHVAVILLGRREADEASVQGILIEVP
jgi:hypothetical protein